MTKKPNELYKKIAYSFQDEVLIRTALTHRSYGVPNNERLEFLGDSILNMIIAKTLYVRCPSAQEGVLSRLRASYVSGKALAKLAHKFDLGQYIYLGSGELKSGGRNRDSILSDTLEALIGAIFLEAGFERCQEIVHQWFDDTLLSPSEVLAVKDPKTQLQEYLQAQRCALPSYSVKQISGKAHCQRFLVCCDVLDLNCSALGEGSSRRQAEQKAAEQCLKLLSNNSTKAFI